MNDDARAGENERTPLRPRRTAPPQQQEQQGPQQQVEHSFQEPDDDRFPPHEDLPPYERDEYVALAAKPEEPQLPRNVEAEAALLGACMIDNRIIENSRTMLEARHFFEPFHGRMWAAMIAQVDRDMLVTPITLIPVLRDDPALAELGGPAYLGGLTGSGAGLIGASSFAKQIVQLAARRDLFATFAECSKMVLDTSEEAGIEDAVGKVDEAMSAAMALDRRKRADSGVTVQQAWDEAFEDMEQTTDTGVVGGVRIDQYEDWNDVVGPLGEGDLVYLGGRPSMGKTGVAVKVMMGAAAAMASTAAPEGELPGAVEFFSLEMSRKPIMQRAIADAIFKPSETSSFDHLINGKMTSLDRQLIRQMREQIDTYPLHISDPATEMMVENFASEVRRRQRAWEKKGRKLKLVIVDYLGRFGTLGKFNGNPSAMVSHISKTLKSAAKDCGVALVVLVQLSRGVESRDDKRPMLQDLRDSGSLEQDADVVAFVYRDQYYLERAEPPRAQEAKWEAWDLEMQGARDRMELLGAKRRQGALVRRTGYFITASQAVRSSEWRWGDDLFSFGD